MHNSLYMRLCLCGIAKVFLAAFVLHGSPRYCVAEEAAPLLQHGMLIGADYYPEHWPRERWETDLQLMQDAGFNVVRLAEFSWGILEPEEEKFDFAWLDEALALCQKHKIHVILGTPTAIMPAWLAQKYPKALSMKADGTRIVWGGRRHNCFSDPDFRRLADRIVHQLVERYAAHPAVIGWQIDNELGGTDCRCEKCRAAFQDWLHERYDTFSELNRAWGNHFWSLNITDWKQIPIPDQRVGTWAISNPSASLDWNRFGSHLNVEFLNRQAEAIRRRAPVGRFVTHNLMGLYSGLDYYELARQLDFVAWDNYPQLYPAVPYDSALAADVMRGLKQQNFLIMEQTAGPLGWAVYSKNPQPGELRAICFQQLAHGADGQIWFRWRSCTAGREQYWHGLLGHDGKPGRRYREAAKTAADYRKLEPYLAGTTCANEVAIIYDYDSIWALEIQPGYPGASHQEAIKRYYKALWRRGVGVDVVSPDEANLSRYKLVIAPHLHILSDEVAKRLTDFVASGGVLLTDTRTAVKDESNLAYDRTLPGALAQVLGVEIPEYESLRLGISNDEETTYALQIEEGVKFGGETEGQKFTAINVADWIVPTGATSMIRYGEPSLRDYSAITRNKYVKGIAWYVGTIVKEKLFYDNLISQLLADAEITPLVELPLGVEAVVRSGANGRFLLLVNHLATDVAVPHIPAGKEILSDKELGQLVELEPFGVAVIKLED